MYNIQAVDEAGRRFVDDIAAGDASFFSAGIALSVQALANDFKFLLAFNDGQFTKDETWLVSELIQCMPESVVAKSFRSSVKSFGGSPKDHFWIVPAIRR